MKPLLVSIVVAVVVLVGPGRAEAVFPGDPGRIAFARPRTACCALDLFGVSLLGGDVHLIAEGGDRPRPFHPSWSPDGRRLLISRLSEGWGLTLLAPDGRTVRTLDGGRDGSWSPDGARLVHLVEHRNTAGLAISDRRGNLVRLYAGVSGDSIASPSFSPDGRRVAFTDLTDETGRIRVMALGSGSVTTISKAPAVAGVRGTYASLHWSGPRSVIAVENSGGCSSYFGTLTPSCNLDVVEMSTDGSGRSVIVDGPVDVDGDGNLDYPSSAAPSPDGRYLAVGLSTHLESGVVDMGLWVLDRSDGSWRALTESNPLGRPDGSDADRLETAGEIDWQPECTISGTRRDDRLRGTSGPDLICALGGDDRIRGLGGDDVIFGHAGNDVISGGEGRDIVVGNSGRDRCDADRRDYPSVC